MIILIISQGPGFPFSQSKYFSSIFDILLELLYRISGSISLHQLPRNLSLLVGNSKITGDVLYPGSYCNFTTRSFCNCCVCWGPGFSFRFDDRTNNWFFLQGKFQMILIKFIQNIRCLKTYIIHMCRVSVIIICKFGFYAF